MVEAILKVVKGKNRGGIDIKPFHVKNHLWVFVNCLIENPSFDSQTKDTLPLKGKLLNIRDAPFKQVIGNQEIQNLLKILNLDTNKKYEDGPKGLRYGSIMLMTDQDLDGSHIKGLLMNMFQHWWPNLYKHPGFLKEFVTPIVKVSKGPSMQQFFTLTEYHDWRDDHNGGKGFKVKYYKGLGTSTAAEAKEYFRRIRQHEIMFKYKGDSCDEAIDMAFNKKRADDRKVWINCSKDSDFVDHSK